MLTNLQDTALAADNFLHKVFYHCMAVTVIAGVALTIVGALIAFTGLVILLTKGAYAITGVVGAAFVLLFSVIVFIGVVMALTE